MYESALIFLIDSFVLFLYILKYVFSNNVCYVTSVLTFICKCNCRSTCKEMFCNYAFVVNVFTMKKKNTFTYLFYKFGKYVYNLTY